MEDWSASRRGKTIPTGAEPWARRRGGREAGESGVDAGAPGS
jgi:hypothetical protein